MDQLFTIRQLGEKIIEKNKRMVMVCVDLEKAYDHDRVDRDVVAGVGVLWSWWETRQSSEITV